MWCFMVLSVELFSGVNTFERSLVFRFCCVARAALIRWCNKTFKFKFLKSDFLFCHSGELLRSIKRQSSPASPAVTSCLSLRFSISVWTSPQRTRWHLGDFALCLTRFACTNIYWRIFEYNSNLKNNPGRRRVEDQLRAQRGPVLSE